MSKRVIAMSTAVVMATAWAIATQTSADAVTNPLPLSPSGKVAIVEANIEELFNDTDINDNWDMKHLSYRVQNILNTMKASDPYIYAPDIVLLSETTKESSESLATQLTAYTGYTYIPVANAATSNQTLHNAMESESTTQADVQRETAILVNTSTMDLVTTSTSPASSPLTMPSSEVYGGTLDAAWVTLRQSTALVQERSSGALFRVYSAHFRPESVVWPHEERTAEWARFLKTRSDDADMLPAGAKIIIGGDFNRRPCTVSYYRTDGDDNVNDNGVSCSTSGSTASGYWTRFTGSQTDTPYTLTPALDASSSRVGVDNVFANMTLLTGTDDYDYKTYYNDDSHPTYFKTSTDLTKCQTEFYDKGLSSSAGADAIAGCYERYYSDHEFVYAAYSTT